MQIGRRIWRSGTMTSKSSSISHFEPSMTVAIADYALIGDCETAALVCRNGSIDWLCWPRFDSDACFAALLGEPSNGRWLITPEDESSVVSRHYHQDTLILESRFETTTGSVRLIDFMLPRGRTSDLV